MRAEDGWTEETQLAAASHDEEEKAPCMAWGLVKEYSPHYDDRFTANDPSVKCPPDDAS